MNSIMRVESAGRSSAPAGRSITVEDLHNRWTFILQKCLVGSAHVRLAQIGLRVQIDDKDAEIVESGMSTQERDDCTLTHATFHIDHRNANRSVLVRHKTPLGHVVPLTMY